MLDKMAVDIEAIKEVLGNIDNSSMIPGIDYEVSLYLAERGFDDIWDEVLIRIIRLSMWSNL